MQENASFLTDMVSRLPRGAGRGVLMTLLVVGTAGTGSILLRAFRVSWKDRFEQFIFSISLGLAGYGFMIWGVGTLLDLHSTTIEVATILYCLPAVPLAIASTVRNPLPRWRRPPAWTLLALVALGIFVYFCFVASLSPEIYFDARWYHLGPAKHYVEVGSFYNIVKSSRIGATALNPYQEILYTGLFALTGAHGAKFLHFLDAALTVVAIVAFARVHFRSARVGVVAGLAFVSIPVVTWSTATAYNDLPLALYTTLAVHALLRWREQPAQRGWSYLAAACAGYALGVKLDGSFTVAACLAMVAYFSLIAGRRAAVDRQAVLGVLRHLVGLGAVVVVVCLPWMIRAASMTGNPVYPLANGIFRSPYWNSYSQHTGFISQRRESLVELPISLPLTLWKTVTNAAYYHALFGPLFLFAIPVAIGLVFLSHGSLAPAGRWCVAVAALWFLTWWVSPLLDSRYLLTVAPITCLALSHALLQAVRWRRIGRAVPSLVAVALVAIIVLNSQFLAPFELDANSPATLGLIAMEWNYLYKHEPEFNVQLQYIPLAVYANKHLSVVHDKIYDYAGLNGYYLYVNPDIFNGTGYDGPTGMQIWDICSNNAYDHLRKEKVTYVAIGRGLVWGLSRSAVWPHLQEIVRTADGGTLYKVLDDVPPKPVSDAPDPFDIGRCMLPVGGRTPLLSPR